MSQQINLQILSVQVVHENAGVFCGSNLQTGWKSIIKQNQGYGIVSGDSNNLPSNINLVNDTDIMDTLITPTDTPNPKLKQD